MHESVSEVARLRQQIEGEIEAMQRCFQDFAAGVARHEFIRARMEQIGDRQDELATFVGAGDAAYMVCELYINTIG
jgi:hypothetical protein